MVDAGLVGDIFSVCVVLPFWGALLFTRSGVERYSTAKSDDRVVQSYRGVCLTPSTGTLG